MDAGLSNVVLPLPDGPTITERRHVHLAELVRLEHVGQTDDLFE